MGSLENNGKVDVAMRFRRAWSAPAAPLSRLRRGCVDDTAVATAAVDEALPSDIFRLFPTQTTFTVADVSWENAVEMPEVTSATTPAAAAAAAAAPSSAGVSAVSHDALRAELQAAKNQISLLTAASSQSFRSYATLEAENAQLRESNETLQEENDALKARLAQRDDEISEQLHLICDLEKRLEEFSSLTASNKATWNGQHSA